MSFLRPSLRKKTGSKKCWSFFTDLLLIWQICRSTVSWELKMCWGIQRRDFADHVQCICWGSVETIFIRIVWRHKLLMLLKFLSWPSADLVCRNAVYIFTNIPDYRVIIGWLISKEKKVCLPIITLCLLKNGWISLGWKNFTY